MDSAFAVAVDVGGVLEALDLGMAATRADLRSVAELLAGELVERARAKADGDVLHVRSGTYLRSIQASVALRADDVAVVVSSDAPGAGLLEYGGTIPAHDILPSAAEALRFMRGAVAVYAASVHVPAIEVRPHSVIHAAFEDMGDVIRDTLEGAGGEAWSALA